ncbi:RING-box protein 1 [Sarotherodon galilaeus]
MSANPSFSSDELEISKGTILGDHHVVEAFLGEGSFGVVTKCRDTKNNQTVAIKVNKSDPEILQQAKQEIFILEQLQRLDPDRCNILANALFHLGSVGIVHADLKPVNIMVVNRHESPIKVKLIDFGIACNTSAVIAGGAVGTIGYCAPEIMLGTPYDEAIDMWSLGLVMLGIPYHEAIDMWALGLVAVELATGVPLYPGEDDYDVLKFIIETQGQLPDHLLESGLYTDCYFIEDNYNEQRWTFKTQEQFQYETDYQSKETRYIKLKRLDDLEQLLKVRRGPENGQPLFVRLIKQMLALDANQRITPSELLKHPFFDPGLSGKAPCTDMNSTGGENLVLSQQPSSWKSHGAQKFNCSFQNSVEFPQKGQVNTSANPSSSEDDLEITEGTILGDHHVVEAFLGEGGFGLVTRCRDTKNNQTVAIKVNKSDPGILLQAKLEIFVLEQLRRLDPDRCNIVKWNGYFLDGERICLNFELLDQSLWDYIRDRNNQGLPIRELGPILHQLANALFHLGSVGIVHADLKPGNIMVVNRHESPIKVKLIDFGLAFPASALIPGYRVGTVGYCAPEVMLGLPYHEAIDMWSLGLVAVELATGLPLYPGEDYYDVLKFIIETQGQLPDHLLESGLYTDWYFIEDNFNEQRWTFKTQEQFQYETGYQSKETRYIKLKCLDHLERLLKVRRGPENGQPLFVRLIKEMLALDANQRITPSEVLKHPFFDPDLSRRTPRHRYE